MKNKKRGMVGHNGSDAFDKWAEAALSSDAAERMNIPLYVLMNEAVDLARFAEHYWAAKRDAKGKITQPGLELAARKEGLSENPTADLLGLQEALQTAQTRYLLTVEPESDSPGDRGEIILGELRATLEYFFDDGVQNEDDVRLARLEEQHAQPLAQAALAGALEDYAALADLHRKPLEGFGGFDVELIDEARAVAKQIREASASRVAGASVTEQRSALELRNQIASLLLQKMNRVRAAARFVFRNDPAIVRRATSAYERRRRAARRKPVPVPVPPSPPQPTPVTPVVPIVPVVTSGTTA